MSAGNGNWTAVFSGTPNRRAPAAGAVAVTGRLEDNCLQGDRSTCGATPGVRTSRICSFIRVIRQDESPRRTVQYPPFGGRRPDFGSLIASGSDLSGTSDLEFSALRPYCQRVHGQRSLLAS